jgi:hypothetical protein
VTNPWLIPCRDSKVLLLNKHAFGFSV